MRKLAIFCLTLSILLHWTAAERARADEDPAFCTQSRSGVPAEWITPAAGLISFYETSKKDGYNAISPDFDCQGVSIGVLQWNAGKGSLGTLVGRIRARNPKKYDEIMGPYASEFRHALRNSRAALAYVRRFQRVPELANCRSDRQANWTEAGQDFAHRLSDLAGSEAGVVEQNNSVSTKLTVAWNYAHWWVESDPVRKGAKDSPTIWETTFFADTLTFNGCFHRTANFKLVREFIERNGPQGAKDIVIKYLRGTPKPEVSQFQPKDARETANILEEEELDERQLNLLVFSYLTAINLKKYSSAATFRYNTIIRRSAIVLGTGYVNGERIRSGLTP